MRRAVRYGDGYHPIRIRVDWFRDEAIPRLKAIADEEGKAMPSLCPRIRLRITDNDLQDDQRIAGEGSVDQIRRDMAQLEELGCSYVLLDTYYDDIEATRHNEVAWRMLSEMAEKVLDLGGQTVR